MLAQARISKENGDVASYSGVIHHLPNLKELKTLREKTGNSIVFAIPFSQIQEKGSEYVAHGNEAIIALEVKEKVIHTRKAIKTLLKGETPSLANKISPSIADETFQGLVSEIQEKEIASGNLSQVILSRRFNGKLENMNSSIGNEIYHQLLSQRGQYMTFFLNDGERSLMAATPERHLEIRDGKVVMNPIAGTMPKGDFNNFEERLGEFLKDKKETNELYQVLDEELKMMARICPKGGKVSGPFLRETGAVIHTEYLLEGISAIEATEALHHSFHAPTLVGGPLASASQAIKRHESNSREYYGGEVGILHSDGSLDSGIGIRMADIKKDGSFLVQAGAGIVKDSDPKGEANETRAKAAGMLGVIQGNGVTSEPYLKKLNKNDLNTLLKNRNAHLSHFHLENQENLCEIETLKNKQITIINNEDDFAYMIGHMTTHMGAQVEVIDTLNYSPEKCSADIVILGPGPGDINDPKNERMVKLLKITNDLHNKGRSTLGICLGHQALSRQLGMEVVKQDAPTQGMQKTINLYGKEQKVALYNSFSARGDSPDIDFVKDDNGNIMAMRQDGLEGLQFHPESVMSENGYGILKDSLVRLVGGKTI